jgi:hypothetical protein
MCIQYRFKRAQGKGQSEVWSTFVLFPVAGNKKPGIARLYFHLLKLTWGLKSPSNPKGRTSGNKPCLLNNGWPPAHQVLCLAPVGSMPPLLRQAKDRQPTLPKCPFLSIALGEFVLGYDGPSTFIPQLRDPVDVARILLKFIFERDNGVPVSLTKFV